MKPAVFSVATALLSAACAQILDIEDAHLVTTAGAGGAVGANAAGASPPAGAGGANDVTSSLGGRAANGGAGGAGGRVSADGADDGEGGDGEGGDGEGGDGEGGDGGGGGGGDEAGSAGTGNPPSACDDYCSLMTKDCSGNDAQYIDADACQKACRLFPLGTPGDAYGNTVDCRLTYANKAHTEPYTYCTWAGPGGNGKCGTNCEGFCTLMMAACTAASAGPGYEYFESFLDCQTACNEVEDIGFYNTSDRSLQKGADTVQCRLYHVGAALANDDSYAHCPHAIGESLCVNAASGLEASRP